MVVSTGAENKHIPTNQEYEAESPKRSNLLPARSPRGAARQAEHWGRSRLTGTTRLSCHGSEVHQADTQTHTRSAGVVWL